MKRFYSILPWLLLALTATAQVKVKKGFPEPVPKRAVLNQPSAKVSVFSESQATGVECFASTQVDYNNEPGVIRFYSGDTYDRTKVFCVSDEASDPLHSRTMLGGALYKDPATNEVSYVGYEVINYDLDYGSWPERFMKVDLSTGEAETISNEIAELKASWYTVVSASQNPVTGKLWAMCNNDARDNSTMELLDNAFVSRIGTLNMEDGSFEEKAKLEHYYMGMAFDADGQLWAIRPILTMIDVDGDTYYTIDGSILTRLDVENHFAELDAIQLTTAADGSSRPFLMWWNNSISFDYDTGNLYALLCEYNDYGYCYQYMYRIDTQTGELKHPATGESGPGAYLNDICYGLAIPSTFANIPKGLEKLNHYLDRYFNCPDLSFDFPAGNSPGFYQAEVVAEAQVVVDKANDVSNGVITLSDAEIDELCAQLKAAYKKLQESKIPLGAGYYFIYNDSGRYLYAANQGETTFLFSNNAYSYEIPETLSYKDLRYIWKVTPASEGNDLYLVENVLNGLVISGQEASYSRIGISKGFTLASSGSVKINEFMGEYGPSYLFFATGPTENGYTQYSAKYDNGPVIAYENDIFKSNNCMHFVTVTEEEVNAIIGQEFQIDCTVGAAGVGTLILPFAAELPKDMQAYRCTGVDGTRVLTQAVDEIPANVPLLVMALPGTYHFTGVPEGTKTNYTDGLLTGVMIETLIFSGYVLQQQDVVAFYPVDDLYPITVPAYKCYLNYTGEQQAMRLDDVLTGLKGVTASEGDATLYDLQGRRTRTATAPGVYIQNNRKIVKSKK